LLLLSDPIECDVPLPLAIVEELLARDLVVLDRVDADLFERDPLAGGFGRNFEGEVDGELVGAVEETDRGPVRRRWCCWLASARISG
jgi:hypothetical protein